MRQYLISIYHPSGEGQPDPDFLTGVMRELGQIQRELVDTSCWVFGQGLHDPSTATVLRPKGDEVLVTDGPFVEGKEYLGGFTILRAADLDSALDWGRRYAVATTLPVEVRPFQGGAED